jgi:hypothetical protein
VHFGVIRVNQSEVNSNCWIAPSTCLKSNYWVPLSRKSDPKASQRSPNSAAFGLSMS